MQQINESIAKAYGNNGSRSAAASNDRPMRQPCKNKHVTGGRTLLNHINSDIFWNVRAPPPGSAEGVGRHNKHQRDVQDITTPIDSPHKQQNIAKTTETHKGKVRDLLAQGQPTQTAEKQPRKQ